MPYAESVVTFIDILGFGNMVTSNQQDDEPIRRVLNRLRQELAHGQGTDPVPEWNRRFTNFSDCCVRSTPLTQATGNPNNQGVLFHEILELVQAQALLIHHEGVFLRGAITMGPISHQTDLVFGPALVRAYELESKVATFPRIIIDPELVRAYRTQSVLHASWHNHEEDAEYVMDLVKQSDDGTYFIDYLRASESEYDDETGYLELLQRHRDLITARLQSSGSRPDIGAKYAWLASYHNQRIAQLDPNRLATFDVDIDSLRISGRESAGFYQLV